MTKKEAYIIADENLKGLKINEEEFAKVRKQYATNIKYWADRSEASLIRAEQIGLKSEKIIQKLYKKSIKKIEDEIAKTYGRYLGEEISYSEMQKKLTREELQNFRSSFNEYNELAKNSPELTKEIKEVQTKAKVTRLEALKDNINVEIKALRTNTSYETENALKKVIESSYEDFENMLVENDMIKSFSMPSANGVEKWLRVHMIPSI